MSPRQDRFLNYITALEADVDIPAWSGYMPDKLLGGSTRFYDLPTALRALMIADGTVTMALEVIYQEPIEVSLIAQHSLRCQDKIALLEAESGEELLYREVELRGVHSQKHYVRAYSLLRRDALADSLWQQLSNREVGMGVVLRNAAQGSFRKVLHMGLGDLQDPLAVAAAEPDSRSDNGLEGGRNDAYAEDPQHAHRTYSVTIDNRAAILITEVFSMAALARD